MSAAVLYIDCGHGWKGAGQGYDPGALHPLHSKRTPGEHHLTEAVQVRGYAACIEAEARAAGLQVERVPDLGRYADRHAWVAHHLQDHGVTSAVYVQAHGNASAGLGTYGLVEHDARSVRGATVAEALAEALIVELGGILPGYSARTALLRPGDRGHTCIAGIYALRGVCGLILEPGFIDSPSHDRLWTPEGWTRIARAVVRGLRPALGASP